MPNNRELEIINSSGDLTEIKLGGAGAEKVVLTKEQVEALFGNFGFRINDMEGGGGGVILSYDPNTEILTLGGDPAEIRMALSVSNIDAANPESAVTKEWTVGKFNAKADGASGSFTAQSGETVTVVDGLITSIS